MEFRVNKTIITTQEESNKLKLLFSNKILIVKYIEDVMMFIYDLQSKWLYVIIKDLYQIQSDNIDINELLLYLGNSNKLIIDELSTTQNINNISLIRQNLYDLQLTYYLYTNQKMVTVQNIMMEKYMQYQYQDLDKIIPLSLYINCFLQLIYQVQQINLNIQMLENKQIGFYNHIVLPEFFIIENNGIRFNNEIKKYQYKFSTKAGRPTIISEWIKGYNLLTIPKDSAIRQNFKSRFGNNGYLLQIDFHAFHIYIISKILHYDISNITDVYSHFAKQLYGSEQAQNRQKAKVQCFQILYGYGDILSLNHQFFTKFHQFREQLWNSYLNNEKQYLPSIERISKNISSKEKLINYFILNLQLKVNIQKIKEINKYVANFNSRIVLYKYDSILLDVHVEDKDLVKNVINIMKKGGYSISVNAGTDYGNMFKKL